MFNPFDIALTNAPHNLCNLFSELLFQNVTCSDEVSAKAGQTDSNEGPDEFSNRSKNDIGGTMSRY